MASDNVIFSVVIPLFNKAPHIERAIASALAQTLPPHEIIVVDDGSTDGSLEIVRAMKDARITVLTRSPPGPGGYAARNLGVEKATGDWVAFLDADDLWYPDHLINLSNAIMACMVPVGCAFSRFVLRQKGQDRKHPVADRILKPSQANDLTIVLRAWIAVRKCPLWTGAVAFRRDILIQAGLFPAGQARRGGDKDLWLRCLALSATAYAPQISAEFHQDTVNRVTVTTRHADVPIICKSIADLTKNASPRNRRLLKGLSNQEVALYVRYATKFRTPTDFRFARALYLPQGIYVLIEIIIYMTIGRILQVIDPRERFSL